MVLEFMCCWSGFGRYPIVAVKMDLPLMKTNDIIGLPLLVLDSVLNIQSYSSHANLYGKYP